MRIPRVIQKKYSFEPLDSIPSSPELYSDDGNDGSSASDISETSSNDKSSGREVRYITRGEEELKRIKNIETTTAIFNRFHEKPSRLLRTISLGNLLPSRQFLAGKNITN